MKNLVLENYGLVELNNEEKKKIDGGWITAAIVCAFVISAMNNWGDIREGFSDGQAGTPRHWLW